MTSWTPRSEQKDRFQHGDVLLTLATWQPEPFFSPSYEIGFRNGDYFQLIQWRGIASAIAWDIAKRMVVKGKSVRNIQRVLDRIGS